MHFTLGFRKLDIPEDCNNYSWWNITNSLTSSTKANIHCLPILILLQSWEINTLWLPPVWETQRIILSFIINKLPRSSNTHRLDILMISKASFRGLILIKWSVSHLLLTENRLWRWLTNYIVEESYVRAIEIILKQVLNNSPKGQLWISKLWLSPN